MSYKAGISFISAKFEVIPNIIKAKEFMTPKTYHFFPLLSHANIFTVNESYFKKIVKPWGYELHWVEENRPYMGKIIHIDANKRLSLQTHDQKQESWFLIKGRAKIIWDDVEGNLVETEMEKGRGY